MLENIVNEIKEAYSEPEGLYDWYADQLDVNYVLDRDRRLIGQKIYITLGGPTIWLDTRDCMLYGAWGLEKESCGVDSDICEALIDFDAEWFE